MRNHRLIPWILWIPKIWHVEYWRLSKPSVAFCEDHSIAESWQCWPPDQWLQRPWQSWNPDIWHYGYRISWKFNQDPASTLRSSQHGTGRATKQIYSTRKCTLLAYGYSFYLTLTRHSVKLEFGMWIGGRRTRRSILARMRASEIFNTKVTVGSSFSTVMLTKRARNFDSKSKLID